MSEKYMAIAVGVLGAVLIVGSIVTLNLPDDGKWFPVLLIGGAAAIWFGVHKYRWA